MSAVAVADTNGKLRGHWKLEVFEGELPADFNYDVWRVTGEGAHCVDIIEGENLVVTVGKQMILDRLFGLSGVGAMTRIGVGTSATAAAVGDTTLAGSAFKVYDATPIRTALAVACITTFGTGDANLNWQEMGMDNGTTLLNRIAPIGPFNKTAAVSIIATVTFSQA